MATIEKRETGAGIRHRVKVRVKGAAARTRTFKRLTDAKAWAAATESDLGRGAFVPTTADRRRTLGDLIDKFETDQLPLRRGNGRQMRAYLAWWRETIGYLTLDRLTPAEIAGARTKLLKRTTRRTSKRGEPAKPITMATGNRYLVALSVVCKWAVRELHWLPSNPVLSVTKGSEHSGIVRYLDDAERKALLTACSASKDPNVYTFVTLALATGARAGNLRMLTWDDVDLTHWRLRFATTKNNEPRYVPVVGPAQEALRAHWEKDPTQAGWVFKGWRDNAPATLTAAWRRVRDTAGLTGAKHCRIHDLRHTTASYLTMHGATLAEVAEALGHRTLTMARRYSHQSGEHVRSTFERIADRLKG